MKNFKGTKGKWYVGYHFSTIKVTTDLEDICTMDDWCDKGEANARLISKAPELLDMLERITNANPMHEGYHRLKLEAINLIKQSTEL